MENKKNIFILFLVIILLFLIGYHVFFFQKGNEKEFSKESIDVATTEVQEQGKKDDAALITDTISKYMEYRYSIRYLQDVNEKLSTLQTVMFPDACEDIPEFTEQNLFEIAITINHIYLPSELQGDVPAIIEYSSAYSSADTVNMREELTAKILLQNMDGTWKVKKEIYNITDIDTDHDAEDESIEQDEDEEDEDGDDE